MSVTADDVAETLGRPVPATGSTESKQWSLWIGDAERLIARRFRPLPLTALDQDDLDYVIREAVALRVRNPDPVSSTTVSVDDGSVTRRYERASGQIAILPEWWDLLTPAPGADAGAFTIHPRVVGVRALGAEV